jgi:hypothetical protein
MCLIKSTGGNRSASRLRKFCTMQPAPSVNRKMVAAKGCKNYLPRHSFASISGLFSSSPPSAVVCECCARVLII